MFKGLCIFGPLDSQVKACDRPWFECIHFTDPGLWRSGCDRLEGVVLRKHLYQWDFKAKCWQHVFEG